MTKENNVSKLVLHVPLGMNKLEDVKPVSQDMENPRTVFAAKFQSGTATVSVLSIWIANVTMTKEFVSLVSADTTLMKTISVLKEMTIVTTALNMVM